MTELYIATEDALSEAVAERLVSDANQGLYVAVHLGRKGSGYLKEKIVELIKTAHSIPVLLLTDLDRLTCPPALILKWCGRQNLPKRMLFRVVVREIEAWLLADRKGFAHFSGTPLDKIPVNPEILNDPKQTLLGLIRRYGNRKIKIEVLPERGSPAKVGLGYNQILSQFVRETWSPVSASKNAGSLARTRKRLCELGMKDPLDHSSRRNPKGSRLKLQR
jgi:hypothetical protein